jgi:hypothetical protein
MKMQMFPILDKAKPDTKSCNDGKLITLLTPCNRMQQTHLKIVNANHAFSINLYKNTKRKLLKCNADIHFNKTCLAHKITPKYANIKIKTSTHSEAAKITEKQVRTLRIKNEIKYLYTKKQQLNKQLYALHIEVANTWGNLWHTISNNIDNTLQHEMTIKHNNINKKITKMTTKTTVETDNNDTQQPHPFYPRVNNLSNTTFTKDEISLLNKGLKYNLHHKPKQWIQTLAMEADTAINLLNPHEQPHMRHMVAQKLQKIILKEQTQTNNKTDHKAKLSKTEKNTTINIKQKIVENNLITTKADKGNTLVIMNKDDYLQKVQNFISKNNFTKAPNNHTTKLHKHINTTINECKITIRPTDRWKYKNMNPTAPRLHGTIKLHKEGNPIRPVVNWKNSPGYKLATHLTKILKETIQLPNAFNIQNTTTLMHNLKQHHPQTHTKICSFDIKDMYTSIPQKELTTIISNTLSLNNTSTEKTKEITKLVRTILNHNYVQHNNELYTQNEGLAMGAPTSAILAEIFVQHLEHNTIIHTLQKHHIIDYYRYVDDILLIYNDNITNIQDTLKDFNKAHPNIQFTIEEQTDRKLNYLDITITNADNTFTFDIYRKPTSTDLIIRNDSCHPTEHKQAAIKYMTDRMNTYPISTNNKQKEATTINTILQNNGYTQSTTPRHSKTPTTQKQHTENTKKWATFTYVGNVVRSITKLFNNTNLRITYRTNNTIQKHLQLTTHDTDIYQRSGIYELKCNTCPLKYIGQTGRSFRTRHKEHIHAIRTNTTNSKYAQHILDTGHEYGNIKDTLNILHIQKKGPLMNTLEQYQIYKLSINNLQINDTHTNTYNPIFKLITTHFE